LRRHFNFLRPRDENLARAWNEGDPSAVEEVRGLLARIGADEDTIDALALVLALADVERTDRLAALFEGRRNGSLREFDRRRSAQRKGGELDDVEYEVIPTKAITSRRKLTKDAA
jgi:hypothetical protein